MNLMHTSYFIPYLITKEFYSTAKALTKLLKILEIKILEQLMFCIGCQELTEEYLKCSASDKKLAVSAEYKSHHAEQKSHAAESIAHTYCSLFLF